MASRLPIGSGNDVCSTDTRRELAITVAVAVASGGPGLAGPQAAAAISLPVARSRALPYPAELPDPAASPVQGPRWRPDRSFGCRERKASVTATGCVLEVEGITMNVIVLKDTTGESARAKSSPLEQLL